MNAIQKARRAAPAQKPEFPIGKILQFDGWKRLALVSVTDLGFKAKAPYDQVCAAAKKFGLALCERGLHFDLHLHLQCRNVFFFGERLRVASEPYVQEWGDPYIMSINGNSYGISMGPVALFENKKFDVGEKFIFELSAT